MPKIKVLVTDDQTELAKELKSVLETDESLEVVALAKDGFDALEKIEKYAPDVVLLDIRNARKGGGCCFA